MDDKKDYTEQDISSKYILPAVRSAGWSENQIREQVTFTDGRILVKGNAVKRGKRKRADIILYYKPNIPVAIIEAKDNKHSVGAGMQQSLGYAHALEYSYDLDIPVVYSSNGDAFLEHDRTTETNPERTIAMDDFPSPAELWAKYKTYKGIETEEEERIASFDYYMDARGKEPRYYQRVAINKTVETIAKGRKRVLLVMATGTGKTFTAFQIIWRLWRSQKVKRVLFLTDRNALIGQTKRNDFAPFDTQQVMTVIKHKKIDNAFQIYLALYQGLVDYESAADPFKEFSPTFFDLIVVDECHRGSAAENSAWRAILEYFSSAAQIGMTATPKETETVSNSDYFGEPIYSYSLKQGIEDGFLAPYKVIRVGVNVDLEGWRPDSYVLDSCGNELEDRVYNTRDYERNLVIKERVIQTAKVISDFMKQNDRYAKAIVFCVDIDHAERMRQALVNFNADEVKKDERYVMRITGDDDEGKRQLDNFTNPEERYPVIATTSKLMTTGVDAQTCKLIILDSYIGSMTEFKQIIGRGTRINEDYGKQYFTIMDFCNNADKFADPEFDGEPVQVEDYDPTKTPEKHANDNGSNVDWPGSGEGDEAKKKVYVEGVDVKVLNTRVQYINAQGQLVTESITVLRDGILKCYATLDDFLNNWNSAERKSAIIDELENQGVDIDNFIHDLADVKSKLKDMDIFDLICHIAWDKPALTRKERAAKVKNSDYFSRYEGKARAVLESLLDKYAETSISDIENLDILDVEPIRNFGSTIEIFKLFGGKQQYLTALQGLENALYREAA
jgi:type I restriction enzyme R subunit